MQREIQSEFKKVSTTQLVLVGVTMAAFVAAMLAFLFWFAHWVMPSAFSASPSMTGVAIEFERSWFGDARVVVSNFDTNKRQTLFDIQFEDSNERILKFAWSPDGYLAGWLIMDSKRFPMGKRLIIFDFKSFPESPARLKAEVTDEDVIDFEFNSSGVRYLLKNGMTKQIAQ
jgi:hypothetical protein